MTAERAVPLTPWVGCIVGGEPGVALVLTDLGEVRASYGGGMLALIARDRSRVPGPGDWVVLRRWTDGRVTLEAPMAAPEGGRGKVIPLRPLDRHLGRPLDRPAAREEH